MAASNAHFWTGSSWDSSESMMMRSRSFCIYAPSRSYVDMLSGSAATTLIVTLQGAQALYVVISSQFSSENSYRFNVSLATMFQPFAILGLLRLPAALWMSDDHAYKYRDTTEAMVVRTRSSEPTANTSIPMKEQISLLQTDEVASEEGSTGANKPAVRFRPPHGIHGIVTRLFFLLPTMTLAAYSTYSLFPPRPGYSTAAPWFAQVLFFVFFLNTTCFIVIYYFVRGESTTTIIPCLNSIWYKIYSALIFVGMVVIIVLGSIMTRKTTCGQWTTFLPGWEKGTCK
jgi:hypothetical protein